MKTTEHSHQTNIDSCVLGHGIRCGLRVKVVKDCSIHLSAGTAVLASGAIVHLDASSFRYYYTQSPHQAIVKECFGLSNFFELSDKEFDPDTMDDLKQQHPDDVPQEDFLFDKVLAIAFVHSKDKPVFLLISKESLAKYKGITPSSSNEKSSGIFPKSAIRKPIGDEDLDKYFNPALHLPKIRLPRFGYQELALISKANGLKESNIQNPYGQINAYNTIFFEYKAILDKYIYLFQDALDVLHKKFGEDLSHKGMDYLSKYGKVLVAKWQRFCEEGEHLYYIQYFYDWLCDLIAAYNELVSNLRAFSTTCSCIQNPKKCGDLLLLGPILGGNSTYKTVVFRDTYVNLPNEARMQEVRALHWRLLMMIWTFDLPFLGLERVLYSYGFDPGIEEELDSTNYWEWVDKNGDGAVNFEDLPVKATPTGFPNRRLNEQAIPYYYPLDKDSIYSLHQFWDIAKTRLNQADCHFSYNAHFDTPDLPSTDVANDSYTQHEEIIMPLAFNIKNFEYFRIEGHIGKKVKVETKTPGRGFHFIFYEERDNSEKELVINQQNSLKTYLEVYNLDIEIIAINLKVIAGNDTFQLDIKGIDHRPSIQQGQTLVLIYSSGSEQLELEECKKDEVPEIKANVILADFWLPYKYSCCGMKNDLIFELLHPSG